jgi:hypothetical protein
MAFFAMHPEANKPYNWRGMFATKVAFLPGGKNGFFCSQLVTEAYKRLEVRPFASDVTPEKATPNMFVTTDCLLRPVTESCFIELPKRAWVSELLDSRYTVMKAEPVPLAQLTYQMSQPQGAKRKSR